MTGFVKRNVENFSVKQVREGFCSRGMRFCAFFVLVIRGFRLRKSRPCTINGGSNNAIARVFYFLFLRYERLQTRIVYLDLTDSSMHPVKY